MRHRRCEPGWWTIVLSWTPRSSRWTPLGHQLEVPRAVRRKTPVSVEDSRWVVVVLLEMQLETVAVLCGVCTVRTSVLVDVRVRLLMAVQHRFVDARVVAFLASERFRAEVVPEVIFEVVLVLGDEWTFRALQHLLVFDVASLVVPELVLKRQ